MNARKAFHNNRAAAKMAWLERRVFSGRALAVIVVAYGHPALVAGFILARRLAHGTPLASQLVAHLNLSFFK